MKKNNLYYLLDSVTLSGIVFGNQKLGVTFDFDKEDIIDFTQFTKLVFN